MTAFERVSVALVVTVACVVGASGQALRDLGVPEPEAQQQTIQAVLNGYIPSLGVSTFKAASAAVRTTLVQGALAWLKAYTQSPGFKSAYDRARSQEKPEPPEATLSVSERMKQQRAEFDKTAAEMRKNAASQPPEMRKTIEDTIAQLHAQFDEMARDPERMKLMEEANAAERVAAQEEYKSKLAEFDAEHPADPRAAIALRLHHFLDACADVDYKARLTPSGGRMLFANPAYEAKSSQWKMCFRAGPEAVGAARAFSQAWLKELGR